MTSIWGEEFRIKNIPALPEIIPEPRPRTSPSAVTFFAPPLASATTRLTMMTIDQRIVYDLAPRVVDLLTGLRQEHLLVGALVVLCLGTYVGHCHSKLVPTGLRASLPWWMRARSGSRRLAVSSDNFAIYPTVRPGSWTRLFTSTISHANAPHLLYNTFSLLTNGPNLVNTVGNLGFILICLAAALGGTLLHCHMSPRVRCWGASGVCCGISAALYAVRGCSFKSVARWAVVDAVSTFYFRPGVAIWGHAGGAIAGYSAIKLFHLD